MRKLVALVVLSITVMCSGKGVWDTSAGTLCLHCLCYSMSKCNSSYGCAGDINTYVCGPFAISLDYWVDSGHPVLQDEVIVDLKAFARCVNDINCAKRAVEQYMDKYGRDCNGDGTVNCSDYFVLHYFGLSDCGNTHPKSREEIIFDDCILQQPNTTSLTITYILLLSFINEKKH